MVLLLVFHIELFQFFIHDLSFLLKSVLLVVEFVFQSKEMLVKWDTISKECFIARSFVLLVNFSFLEQFNLMLHQINLLLQVCSILVFKLSFLTINHLFAFALFHLVIVLLEIIVSLEFLSFLVIWVGELDALLALSTGFPANLTHFSLFEFFI